MAQCACCNAPISRLTEAVCWRCREILDRKIDAIQAQLYKFRAESETDSQPTMKPVGQYGRAVPQPGVRLKTTNALSDEQGQAEAEGRKRIEVACGPSRNRTLESGEAGEMKAGGDDSNATIGSASVGGLTARRDGQDYAGGGVDGYGGTMQQHKQTPARQHSVPHHEGEGKSDAVKVKGMAEKLGDDSVLLRQASEGCEPLDVLVAGRSICSSHAEDNTAPKSAPPRYPMPPQRVRFGPGALPVTESRYQRYRREAHAYYDAMLADVTSGHVWPVRECAGGCGCLVNGPLDRCRLCRARVISERHELEWEEANNQ